MPTFEQIWIDEATADEPIFMENPIDTLGGIEDPISEPKRLKPNNLEKESAPILQAG